MAMKERIHFVDNGAGWRLALKHRYDPDRLDPARRPVVIVPGYGMNGFVFGWHPSGRSMEHVWVERGFEVWTVNLRGMQPSHPGPGERADEGGLGDYALTDLDAALAFVVRHTATGQKAADLVGCSLGGTFVCTLVALKPEAPVGSIVAVGAPLRWERVHPALRAAFSSPALAGSLRVKGVRNIARLMLPLLAKTPLLHIYMHPAIVDLTRYDILVETVEDPNPRVNGDIARWVRNRDLIVRDENVCDRFRSSRHSLLSVVAGADGIVPPETALSAHHLSGASADRRSILRVGTDSVPMAHADLFVSKFSEAWVFHPIADWLAAQS